MERDFDGHPNMQTSCDFDKAVVGMDNLIVKVILLEEKSVTHGGKLEKAASVGRHVSWKDGKLAS